MYQGKKMASNASDLIEITHFVNPHNFWFKYIKESADFHERNIEIKLTQYAAKFHQNDRRRKKLTVHDHVAVYYFNQKKWIRAAIEKLLNDSTIIVWAIDYGIPMECSAELVITLPEELEQICSDYKTSIIHGGVYGIMPAVHELDVRSN